MGIYTDDFENHREITSVKLSKNMVHVQGFSRCSGITEIPFPDGLERVTGFEGCTGLTEIILPEGIKEVSGFSGCINLKRIVFPKSTERIISKAFEGCISLNEIVFENLYPENISIGKYVFHNTPLVNEAKAKGEPLVLEGGFLIDGSGVLGDVEFDGNEIRAIASNAFCGNKKIREVEIKGICHIGESAFQASGITKLTIIDVGYVDSKVFKASHIKKATLEAVDKIGSSIFEDCRKCKISGVKTIPMTTFFRCKNLKKITLGKETKHIGVGYFYNCQ